MTENQIATIIVDASLKIHRTPGPGLLEHVYEAIWPLSWTGGD